MHKMSPRQVSFRSFSGGGARGTVESMDTSHMFQEMKGQMMATESREGMEHFEPYGYTGAILPKDKNGVAEAMMHFAQSSRAHPIAGVIGDRRFRPMGLKPGETAQYDDIGQMTLLRRNFLASLTHDGEDGQGNKAPQEGRYVSMRHVNKQKQKRPQQGQQMSPQQRAQFAQETQDYKHEGDSVNTEMRSDKNKLTWFDGDTPVLQYDRQTKTLTISAKNVHTTSDKHTFSDNTRVNFGDSANRQVSAMQMIDTNGDKQASNPIKNVFGT